jgi:hypothetical protein
MARLYGEIVLWFIKIGLKSLRTKVSIIPTRFENTIFKNNIITINYLR